MKRVGLKQQFHGEPNPSQEGMAADQDAKDEVILDVLGGTVSFAVPSDVRDDDLLKRNLIERYVNCVLKLENGIELALWINEGAHGVDVRLTPTRPEEKSDATQGDGGVRHGPSLDLI